MQDRLVAEIPAFPSTWRITFELKLTEEPKTCCRNCAYSILLVKGGDDWAKRNLPKLQYRCSSDNPTGDARVYQSNAAAIKITHWFGKFKWTMKRTELLLGKWHRFEISQETERITAKGRWHMELRLMFKVKIYLQNFMFFLFTTFQDV